MKSFLAAWLSEMPRQLAHELGGAPELRPSAHLPQPETATNLAVSFSAPCAGQFLVTADRYALHALFAAARLTDGSLDADRDRELWRGLLRRVAASAAQVFHPAQPPASSVSIDDASWTLGLPSAAYELRFADTVLLLAFTDSIQIAEVAEAHSAPDEKAAPTRSISNSSTSGSANSTSCFATSTSGSAAASNSGPASGTVSSTPGASGPNASGPMIPGRSPSIVAPGSIDLLLDVELEASLRFGSREMPLSEVLDLGAGDVVELDRHVSDPVDLLVGDKIVARGEVVLVNGSFGLRVLEVAEPKKCLESIRCLF